MKLFLVLLLSCLSFGVFAQEAVEVTMSSSAFFEMFIASLGGIKGASTIGIVIIVLQIVFAFLNSEVAGKIGFLRKLNPGTKLLVILVISYATGILTLMNAGQGMGFGAAFIHSTSMSSLMVLANQIYKKFVVTKV